MRPGSCAAPSRLYLEPLDLHWESAASRALKSYGALSLLGGRAAALGVAIWRPERADRCHIVSAPKIQSWLASLTGSDGEDAGQIIARWREARRFPGIERDGPPLMGVVNVTHDSFFAGSRVPTVDAATRAASLAVEGGAAILDVGGQSTRPGSRQVSLSRELSAVVPVVQRLRGLGVPISIDTLRPEVAAAAVSAGAAIVNDISGLMPVETVGDASIIIGDMRGNPASMQHWPRSRRGVFDIYDRLQGRVQACLAAGISRDRIAVDPGFGFGKAVHHNQALIQHLPLFLGLGVAIVVGVSRKGSLGFMSGTPRAEDRLPASLAAAFAAARGGASILRVHDVAATRQLFQVSRTLM